MKKKTLCFKILGLRFVSEKITLNKDKYTYFSHYANVNFIFRVIQRRCASAIFCFRLNSLPRINLKRGVAQL